MTTEESQYPLHQESSATQGRASQCGKNCPYLLALLEPDRGCNHMWQCSFKGWKPPQPGLDQALRCSDHPHTLQRPSEHSQRSTGLPRAGPPSLPSDQLRTFTSSQGLFSAACLKGPLSGTRSGPRVGLLGWLASERGLNMARSLPLRPR